MPFHLRDYSHKEGEDWEVLEQDWWRIPFTSVSWAYASESTPKRDPKSGVVQRRNFEGSLFSKLKPNDLPNTKLVNGWDSLNPDLCGVRSAMEAVRAYEKDVGFHYTTCPSIELCEQLLGPTVNLCREVDELSVQVARQKWQELVDNLMNGPLIGSPSSDSDDSLASSLPDLSSPGPGTLSTFSSLDLSSSASSIDSIMMPSTPRGSSLSDSHIQIKDASPTFSLDIRTEHPSPGRSLNAAASSFVPTFASKITDEPYQDSHSDTPQVAKNKSSPFSDFTFPTLNPPSSVKIKKDDQGFFTEVKLENQSAAMTDLLPPFLQEPTHKTRIRKSKTREIVDRLRSQAQDSDTPPLLTPFDLSPKYASHSPSPMPEDPAIVKPRLSVSEDGDRPSGLSTPSFEDDDGWIDIASSSSPTHRRKRTRELVLALHRRRTDSTASDVSKDFLALTSAPSTGMQSSQEPLTSSPPRTPPPANPNGDGWIENSKLVTSPEPTVPKKPVLKPSPGPGKEATHARRKSSNHVPRPSASSTTMHGPYGVVVPPGYPTSAPAGLAPRGLPPPHVSPAAPMPYFFPPYQAVPMSYPQFVHIPAGYPPMGIPMHAPVGISPVSPGNPPVPYMMPHSMMPPQSAPALRGAPPMVKPPPMATNPHVGPNVNMAYYRTKPQQLW